MNDFKMATTNIQLQMQQQQMEKLKFEEMSSNLVRSDDVTSPSVLVRNNSPVMTSHPPLF